MRLNNNYYDLKVIKVVKVHVVVDHIHISSDILTVSGLYGIILCKLTGHCHKKFSAADFEELSNNSEIKNVYL